MTPARLLIGLLLLATVLVDLVAWSFLESLQGSPPYAWTLLIALGCASLAISQVSLLAIWTSFGKASLPWRLLITAMVITAWAEILTKPAIPTAREVLASARWLQFWVQASVVICVMLAARMKGFTIDALPAQEITAGRDVPNPRQFSLGSLLSWLTALALLLGWTRYTVDFRALGGYVDARLLAHSITFGLCNAILAIAATATAFGRSRARYLVLCLCTTAVILVHAWMTRFAPLTIKIPFSLLHLGWLLGSLWVFRVAGYRFHRASPPTI